MTLHSKNGVIQRYKEVTIKMNSIFEHKKSDGVIQGLLCNLLKAQNKTIKEAISLKDKKYRRKLRKFIIEGYRFLNEAVSSGAVIEKVFFGPYR